MFTKEKIFVKLCKGYSGADVVTEYQFHPKRKWRFDYAIPSHKIAIEVEGGAWINGRHNRASGFLKDMEKYNAAAVLGWRLLRVTPQTLLLSETLQMVAEAVKYENKSNE